MSPKILIITGLPATGKTTLGRRLAERLKIPFLHKDLIKEGIFDGLGHGDRAFSRKVGSTAYDLLYKLAEELLKAGLSFVIESNFNAQVDSAVFAKFQKAYGVEFVQILCHAEGKVLLERFKKRAGSEERHPGHVDLQNLEEFQDTLLKGRCEPLALEGRLIEVDTTDFAKVDFEEILKAANNA